MNEWKIFGRTTSWEKDWSRVVCIFSYASFVPDPEAKAEVCKVCDFFIIFAEQQQQSLDPASTSPTKSKMEFQMTTSCTRMMNGSQSAMVSPPVSPASPKALVRTKPKRAYRKSKPSANSTPKKRLPADFVPGPDSVICGRGKDCFESEGVS